ncbi:hypothetical protein NECAME_08670 [Necator americanus]|uniref:Uncharacterized protein n=1 Tax=Necator americanus TaxID=51031 RepID=W2TGR3_NECAM|nr:hypothetical protein NECAME_08670 [Necator americanus]ETN81230.1 hypothetical protein NECAME_08670 [Necator americanus]
MRPSRPPCQWLLQFLIFDEFCDFFFRRVNVGRDNCDRRSCKSSSNFFLVFCTDLDSHATAPIDCVSQIPGFYFLSLLKFFADNCLVVSTKVASFITTTMACNPCCCFNLKDSAVMIGIWTLVYSIASLFLFGWQTGVLNHCRTVTMSQANLQCEWDCPCVGASTARTTRIIEAVLKLGRKGLVNHSGRPPVFSIAQLGIMGWQMAAIKYEKDRAANTLLPNYNTYGKYDIPSYYESYWQSPEERYYTGSLKLVKQLISGLFIIQILCLIAAFFLLFASVALIYGVHTWSRHLIWPWFICIISSILSSLAYCIMWWAGDVRDYWMALTILEIIAVFINVYCVVVVYMFMKRLTATTDEYEGKDPRVRYKVNRNGYMRKNPDDFSYDIHRTTPEKIMKSSYPNYTTPIHQSVPPYSPSGMPQTPLPMPPSQYPSVTPYPVDDHEQLHYDREPKTRFVEKEDPVAHWVKDQQRIERGEVNSEPVSPSREARMNYPLQVGRCICEAADSHAIEYMYAGLF